MATPPDFHVLPPEIKAQLRLAGVTARALEGLERKWKTRILPLPTPWQTWVERICASRGLIDWINEAFGER